MIRFAQALELEPDHLSLYSLIVEENTPLHHWVETGSVAAPDDDLAALHYEIAMDSLDAAGYEQYEVSNWVRPKRIAPDGGNSRIRMAGNVQMLLMHRLRH